VRFTYRGSWKAEIRAHGQLIAIAPVVWTEDRRQSGREAFQAVRFKDPSEMEQTRVCREPFIMALAKAENYESRRRKVKVFQGIFEVVPNGIQIRPDGIDTRVIRRRYPDEFNHQKLAADPASKLQTA
jgi:hypothetical protein